MESKVEAYRRFYKYTQADFARIIKKDRKTYNMKARGKIKFSPYEMLLIRNELRKHEPNLTIDDIFFGS
jgi:DNA-binding XRE family transcriptional regulator